MTGCGTVGSDAQSTTVLKLDAIERVAEKGPVKLTVRVTPREPRLSDLVTLEIQVNAPSGVQITPPAFGQAVGDFLVRNFSERRPARAKLTSEPGNTERRFEYQLEPVHAGRHLVRSVAMEFVDNRPDSEQRGITSLIETDPLEVMVTSELGDQLPNLADLTPMVSPRPLSSAWSSTWIWMIVIAVAIASIAILFQRRRRSQVLQTVPLSPQEIAHAALTKLLSENLPARGLYPEFYVRLTGIVRQFIEGTTGLKAPEQTTEEFLRAIRTGKIFSPERSTRLKDFLEAADMVKYAGQQPDNDQLEISIARAREFVDFQSPVLVDSVTGIANDDADRGTVESTRPTIPVTKGA